MKSAKDSIRRPQSDQGDSMRKAAKLDPFNRKGKDRHNFYKSLDGDNPDDEDDSDELYTAQKRESILDYLDDEED